VRSSDDRPKPTADFTYSISGNVISIVDLDLGNRSVTNDIESVLRKIEHYHQGSIGGFRIMYRDSEGIWDGIEWDGEHPSFFELRETDESQARHKLLNRKKNEELEFWSIPLQTGLLR
jgi:hypothetical protein